MAPEDLAPEPGDQAERWLTVYEVAGQLLARPDTVKSWVRDGLLEGVDRGRLGLRIPQRAVDDVIHHHFQAEGFRAADHSFSSGVGEDILTATDIPEQALERQGAGWPFRRDSGVIEPNPDGASAPPGL